MSCNWDIHCIDCDEDAGMEINHGDRIVRMVVEHRAQLERLGELLAADGVWDVTFQINGNQVFTGFFMQHRGHRLMPQNEYGELDTPCGQTFECPICGPVACERLDHSIAGNKLHSHSRGTRHWEKGGD